jgi:hypothetical protein
MEREESEQDSRSREQERGERAVHERAEGHNVPIDTVCHGFSREEA